VGIDSRRHRRGTVVTEPRRGEVWWGEIAEVGRRPFLVMTRNSAIPVLHTVLAAPITRTVRGIPTELQLGPEDGMPAECAASFDNLRVVPKRLLVDYVCTLGPLRLAEACRALRNAVDC
jgi:mRNA interferase MazF